MARHWILNREDPRTVLTFCIVVLIAGLVPAAMFIRDGGAATVFAIVWIAVSAGQVVWAGLKVRAWSLHDRG